MATKAYLDLVTDVTNRPYVPNGNGPMKDQLSAAIVKGGVIDDAFIILCVQYAFTESSNTKERTRTIGKEWATLDTNYENAHGAVVHLETQFGRFQNYYNKRLKELYDNDLSLIFFYSFDPREFHRNSLAFSSFSQS